jgi:uncharacterized membrane protein HdeD (DUF308 family)
MTTADPTLEQLQSGAQSILRMRWWALVMRGVIAVIFGVLAFATPLPMLLSLVLLFGIFAVADGIAGLIAAVGRARNGESWVWLAIGAVAGIVVGILAFVWPVVTAKVLTLFIAANAAITGVVSIVSGFRLDADHGRWWLILAGIAGLVFAFLIFANPFAGALAITWIIGAWATAIGFFFILLGFTLRSARKKVEAKVASLLDTQQPQG